MQRRFALLLGLVQIAGTMMHVHVAKPPRAKMAHASLILRKPVHQAAARLFVLSQGLGQTAGTMMLTPAVKLLRSQMDNAWLIANNS